MALWISRGARNVLITTACKGHNWRALFNEEEIEMKVYFLSLYSYSLRCPWFAITQSHPLLTVRPGTGDITPVVKLAGFSAPRLIPAVALV